MSVLSRTGASERIARSMRMFPPAKQHLSVVKTQFHAKSCSVANCGHSKYPLLENRYF